ncbi:MAG: nucleotide disphospho-sugar-binding domain-containing protein, partial [Beijerinckiaceae bacterium]
ATGDEIFVYLSNSNGDPDYLFDSLGEFGAPVRVFAPWLVPEKAAMLERTGARIESKLLAPEDIARRTRLMMHYGQPGTTALGMALGIPQVAMPQHIEQMVHAERAARKGSVRVVRREGLDRSRFIHEIRAAYADDALLAAARRIAPEVRAELDCDGPEMIREAMRPLLVGVIRRKGLA